MSKNFLFGIIGVLIIVCIVEGFWIVRERNAKIALAMGMTTQKQGMQKEMGNGKKPPMGAMTMTAVTPPPASDQQTQQLIEGTSTTSTQKTFNITGGDFYFVPNKITVNKGDSVTFNFTNGGGVHNLKIDELGVNMPTSTSGQTETATFTASKTGSFVFYCAIPGHREKGMWGTLIVQ